jgi:hypothetical protein
MKKTPLPAEFRYLNLMPLQSSRPVGVREPVTVKKDVPYFLDLDIEFLLAGERRLEVAGVEIVIRSQVLDRQIWLAECRFCLPDILTETAAWQKQVVQAELKKQLQQEIGYGGTFIEEYVIILLQKVQSTPDELVAEHAPVLARLLRSLDKPLTDVEMDQILAARARYADDDLTIVDIVLVFRSSQWFHCQNVTNLYPIV